MEDNHPLRRERVTINSTTQRTTGWTSPRIRFGLGLCRAPAEYFLGRDLALDQRQRPKLSILDRRRALSIPAMRHDISHGRGDHDAEPEEPGTGRDPDQSTAPLRTSTKPDAISADLAIGTLNAR